jgi:hypothetical protein
VLFFISSTLIENREDGDEELSKMLIGFRGGTKGRIRLSLSMLSFEKVNPEGPEEEKVRILEKISQVTKNSNKVSKEPRIIVVSPSQVIRIFETLQNMK